MHMAPLGQNVLISAANWGRVTHIYVNKQTIIGSDNGLSPGQCQAIIWTNAGILLIGPLGTNFNEISIEIHILSFKKMHLKLPSGKWQPFCLGLNVLITVTKHYRKTKFLLAYGAKWIHMQCQFRINLLYTLPFLHQITQKHTLAVRG